MTEVNAVTSAPSESGVRLGLGPYAYSDLTILPDWYLAQLLGGVADPKWDKLTPEQQAAVVAENVRRHPKSEKEAAEEAQTRANTAAAAAAEAAHNGLPAPDAAADAAVTAAPNAPHTRESDATLLSGTVAEVSTYIALVSNTTELDALKTAEEAGKDRAGVLDAIEKRRVALTAAQTPIVPEA
jgi:hypothetical protein